LTQWHWFGWGLLFASTFMLNHFELFGLSQVFARLFGSARRCSIGWFGTRSI
jgi:hypothetical protein